MSGMVWDSKTFLLCKCQWVQKCQVRSGTHKRPFCVSVGGSRSVRYGLGLINVPSVKVRGVKALGKTVYLFRLI